MKSITFFLKQVLPQAGSCSMSLLPIVATPVIQPMSHLDSSLCIWKLNSISSTSFILLTFLSSLYPLHILRPWFLTVLTCSGAHPFIPSCTHRGTWQWTWRPVWNAPLSEGCLCLFTQHLRHPWSSPAPRFRNMCTGARERALWLRPCTTPPEDGVP